MSDRTLVLFSDVTRCGPKSNMATLHSGTKFRESPFSDWSSERLHFIEQLTSLSQWGTEATNQRCKLDKNRSTKSPGVMILWYLVIAHFLFLSLDSLQLCCDKDYLSQLCLSIILARVFCK